jgi:membrane-associated phospholipid phosphatase
VLLAGAPLLYVGWGVQNGRISNLDVSVRAQRIRPLSLTLGGAAAGWTILHLWGAPRLLCLLATLNLAQTALFLAITFSRKISMHCTAVSTFAVFIWFLFGTIALPALLGAPLVAWARLRLRRHTLAETVAGCLLGSGMTLFIIWVYGG